MIHDYRTFRVKRYTDVDEMAKDLTGRTMTLCTGFEFDGLLYLNDSFSEDGAQEYAVVLPVGEERKAGIQVESITFGWLRGAPEKAVEYIRDCSRYVKHPDMAPISVPITELRLEHPDGSCNLCQ